MEVVNESVRGGAHEHDVRMQGIERKAFKRYCFVLYGGGGHVGLLKESLFEFVHETLAIGVSSCIQGSQ